MCLERLISLTGPTGILEGAGSLASLRVGVMQIAEFGFNLFADEHPSPEVGGGGVHNPVLIIWGIIDSPLSCAQASLGATDLQ